MMRSSEQLLSTALNFASINSVQISHHLLKFCKSRITKSQVITHDLHCDQKTREHLKYLRNVYCVMTNHNKDQDT